MINLSNINVLSLYIVGIVFVLFLIGRFVTLWYFRINDIVSLLEKIEENIRKEK